MGLIIPFIWLPFFLGGNSPLGIFLLETWILAVLMVGLLLSGTRGFHGFEIEVSWDVPILSFMVLGILSYAISSYRFSTQLELVKYFIYGIYFYLLFVLFGKQRLSWIFASILFSSLIQCAVVIYELWAEGLFRPKGTFFDPNYAAGWMFFGFLISLGRVKRHGIRSRMGLLFIASALFLTAGILATGSRVVFLMLVITGAISLVVWRSRVRFVLMAVILLTLIVPNPARDRLVGFKGLDKYAFERLNIWRATLRIIKDHPLVGVSLGNLPDHTYAYNFPVDSSPARYSKRFKKAHNSILQICAEMGIPGAVALLTLLVRWAIAWGRIWRVDLQEGQRSDLLVVGSVVFAFCVQGLLSDDIFSPPLVMGSLAMLAATRAWETSVVGHEALSDTTRPSTGMFMDLWKGLKGPGYIGMFMGLILGLICWPLFVLNPYLAWRNFTEAQRRANAGDLVSAERLTRKALRWNPAQPYMWSFLAEIKMYRAKERKDSKMLAKAYSYLTKASSINSRDPMLYEQLARFCLEAHELDGGKIPTWLNNARHFYEEAVLRNPLNPFYRYHLASVLWRLGDLRASVRELRAALELEPNFIAAHKRLAELYHILNEQALSDYHRRRAAFLVRRYGRRIPRNSYEEELFKVTN